MLDYAAIELDLLSAVHREIKVTNRLLLRLLKQEEQMATALEQAFADFDAEVFTIAKDISDLVARLNAMPPGVDANAVASQIETKLAALKAAADPLKDVAVTPPPPPPPPPVEPPPTTPTP
jgi:hypothetical protein